MTVVFATALTFGGIHCTGWSFAFPSSTERILWRVASVYITAAPALFIMIASMADDTMFNMFLSSYILGRLVLLVLPFLSLRSLPTAAYHVVHWTLHIPHV
ncbi:hypothetical protein F5148DRAFT_1208326 [Russula earlei]|uniref:Uncharacterized protein n=1 Tax=Russula earlei TaxID=71964 RepID=A0ACC0U7J3_9AGAM|nr:hypothetical protein F5148DRAFT_1208326 [Russula earlei]